MKSRSWLGAAAMIGLALITAALLVPSFATGLGRLLGGLWVTVMSAVVGLLGAVFGL